MKYIRTKNKIFEVVNSFVDYHQKRIYEVLSNQLIEETEVVKEADTIEELIMVGDLVFVIDDKGNKMSIYVEDINYLNVWIKTHDIYKINEVYIKVNDDYICVAKPIEKEDQK